MKNCLATAKVNPDMDGVASAIAYSYLCGADVVFYGRLQPEPDFVLRELGVEVRMNEEGHWGCFAIVDASSMRGMPRVIDPKRVAEVVDHRFMDLEEVKKTFPNARIQIEPVGAAATLLGERFRGEMPKEVGCLIYAAIVSNTLNLQTSNTTERDVGVLKRAEETCPGARDLAMRMFRHKTEYALEHLKEVIEDDFKWWPERGFGIAQLEVFEAEKFLERLDELTEILEGLKEKHGLRYILLNLPEIKGGKSFWIFPSKEDAKFFLGEKPVDTVIARPLTLRKQILKELT